MKKTLRKWMIGLCGVFATFGLIAGVLAGAPAVEVSANSAPSTVTMLAGASARKTPGEPGIKFTAQINNYNSAEYTYGMLILPEKAWDKFGWDNNTDFIAELDSIFISEKIIEWVENPAIHLTSTSGQGTKSGSNGTITTLPMKVL